MKEYKLSKKYKYGIDYKTRNFIFFVIILVGILTFFFFQLKSAENNKSLLMKDYQRLNNEFNIISAQLTSVEDLKRDLSRIKDQLLTTEKIIPNKNNTASTLSYIFQIFDKYSLNIDFNYRYLGQDKYKEDETILFNRYLIEGRAFINEFYVFLDQLERQVLVYTVESISINSLSAAERGKLFFRIELNAYYSHKGQELADIKLNNLNEIRLPNNIFYQRIHEPLVPSEEKVVLLNVNNLEFIGLTKYSVFYYDKSSDSYGRLQRGDNVLHGYLQSINWDTNEVVFRLRPHGIWENYRFRIIEKNN